MSHVRCELVWSAPLRGQEGIGVVRWKEGGGGERGILYEVLSMSFFWRFIEMFSV